MQFHRRFFPFLVVCILFICSGCAARNPDWATPVSVPGLPNLYQVSPMLYRSAQPSIEGFEQAARMGITTVINLHGGESKAVASQGMTSISIPSTSRTIGDAEIVTALRVIRDAKGPVLVHCAHGAHRTGIVVAAYRVVFQNWTPQKASSEMTSAWYGFRSSGRERLILYMRHLNPEKLKAQVFE